MMNLRLPFGPRAWCSLTNCSVIALPPLCLSLLIGCSESPDGNSTATDDARAIPDVGHAAGDGASAAADGAVGDRGARDAFAADGAVADMLANACPPSGPYGTKIGDTLPNLTLKDCDGNTHQLHDLCGKKASWIFVYRGS